MICSRVLGEPEPGGRYRHSGFVGRGRLPGTVPELRSHDQGWAVYGAAVVPRARARQLRTSAIVSVAALLCGVVSVRPASASTIRTLAVYSSWSAPNSWAPAGVPADGDSVVLQDSSYFDLDGLTIQDLTANAVTTLASTPARRLNIAGNIAVVAGTPGGFNASPTPVRLLAGTHNITVPDQAAAGFGTLSGPGDLVKLGAGGLSLGGDFDGNLDVEQGTVTGSLGSTNGITTMRSGTTVRLVGPSAEPFTVYAGTPASPTTFVQEGDLSGPITTMGTGKIKVLFGYGDLSGDVSGSAGLDFEGINRPEDLIVSGHNSYTGGTTIGDLTGVTVRGTSPFGIGLAQILGTGSNNAQLQLDPGAYVGAPVAFADGRLIMQDDGVQDPPEFGGAVALAVDTPVLIAGADPSVAVFSGPMSGAGRGILSSINGKPAEVVLGGDQANTNAGFDVGAGVTGPVDVILAKTDGIAALSGTITVEQGGSVSWLSDEQVRDDASIAVGDGGSDQIGLSLNGHTETMGPLRLDGAVLLAAPDASALGTLSVSDLHASATGDLIFTIDGAKADRLVVRNSADLGSAALTVGVVNAPPIGTVLTLASVAGTTHVTGTFANLPEGAILDLGPVSGQLSYIGGDGNDITLTTFAKGAILPHSYAPVVPQRVLETRTSVPGGQIGYTGPKPTAGQTIELAIPNLPTGTGAVALNVTATESASPGFVTVWPCGTTRPTASNLNPDPTTSATANLVISQLGTNGHVCLYTSQPAHLIADLQGTFAGAR